MATIFNNVDKVAGNPQSVYVEIALVWDTDESPIARDISNDSMIQGPVTVDADETGNWTINVVPNDSILPAANAYRIKETIKSTKVSTTYYISVPDAATPEFWVGDLIISTPSWV